MAYDLTQYLITRDQDGSGGVMSTPASEVPTIEAPAPDAPLTHQLAYLAVYGTCVGGFLYWLWG